MWSAGGARRSDLKTALYEREEGHKEHHPVVHRDGGRQHLARLRPALHNQADGAARRVATHRSVSAARAQAQPNAHARQEAELWRARGVLLARSGDDLNQPASAARRWRAVGAVHGGLRGSGRILSRRAGPPPRLRGGWHAHNGRRPPRRRTDARMRSITSRQRSKGAGGQWRGRARGCANKRTRDLKRRPWPRAPLANHKRGWIEIGASGDRSSCPSPQQSGREC